MSEKNDIFLTDKDIDKISKKILNYNWDDSIVWEITEQRYIPALRKYRTVLIKVDPTLPCSKVNPLYKHKEWITRVCNDTSLNNDKRLSNRIISKTCNIDKGAIQRSRNKFNIERYMITKPSKYKPSRSKILDIRREHQEVILKFLRKNPNHVLANKYLIQGRLKEGIEIHHINFDKRDNRYENLWIYSSKSKHQKGEASLNLCFEKLIKMGQITFSQGRYFLNKKINYRSLNYSDIKDILELEKPDYYKKLENIKETIKKIDWNSISQDWTVSFKGKGSNQYTPDIVVTLDPYSDCSKDNPLYIHKQWFERIITDKRFHIQEKDIAQLCGEKLNTIRDWKFRKHKLKKSFIPRRTIVSTVRIPDKDHPFAFEGNRMKLHRYVAEQYLANHTESEISRICMKDGKYLRPECPVHHINYDRSDNNIKNLWVFPDRSNHHLTHQELVRLVPELLSIGFLRFNKGNYELSPLYSPF